MASGIGRHQKFQSSRNAVCRAIPATQRQDLRLGNSPSGLDTNTLPWNSPRMSTYGKGRTASSMHASLPERFPNEAGKRLEDFPGRMRDDWRLAGDHIFILLIYNIFFSKIAVTEHAPDSHPDYRRRSLLASDNYPHVRHQCPRPDPKRRQD